MKFTNKFTDRNHIFISTVAEKVEHPFIVAIPWTLGEKETYHSITKAMCEKPTEKP